MKTVFFTLRPPTGSYGGGAFFVKNLSTFLTKEGYRVVYDLVEGIDLIFIIDPRRDNNNRWSLLDVIKYKKTHPDVHIIHRVNECDIKRERSLNLEPLLLRTMGVADTVIFISGWLRDYFVNKYNLTLKDQHVIYNGCDRNTYFPVDKKRDSKIRLVTHHWSNNYFKGFDVYNTLDDLLPSYPNIQFTFIGNYNNRYRPRNIRLISPTSGEKLANLIREHDIYVTASKNEPCGMHHIEGLSCGLPILYRSGCGGIAEACNDVGEEFSDISSFFKMLKKVNENYDTYTNNINYEKLGSERCSLEYLKIIKTFL